MKKYYQYHILFLAGILAFFYSGRAIAASDFQLWFEAGAKYRINKEFRLDFDQHLRLDDNASGLESISPELAIRYRLYKFLSFKAGYRFSAKPEAKNGGTVYDYWHRIFADARFSQRFKPITLIYRFRFQEQFGWPKFEFGGANFKHTIRNKVELQWAVPMNFTPFFSAEIYARINDNDGILHKYRVTPGVDYKFKKHVFTLYYQLEEMTNGSNDPAAHILGLGYHFEI